MTEEHADYERLVESLNDDAALAEYQKVYADYRPSLLPRIFGAFLVGCGNLVYGKSYSYLKFRAVEVIARVPYHSWDSAAFTLMTLFYTDEKRATRFSTISRFTRFASDNETMHVVVISQLARIHTNAGVLRHTIIPLLFAFFYFWFSYLLYLMSPRQSLELNYIFEKHAFSQYALFLKEKGEELKKCPMSSEFLTWYGRHPRSEYEFFRSVRNDELIHRNRSIHEIELHCGRTV